MGKLKNSIVIIATDNSTFEGVFYRGNSISPLLYELIVRLRQIEMTFGLRLYLTHVSGNRMKKQGTDGLSRGHYKEGVCIGDVMAKYCPWDKTSAERSPCLRHWLSTWLPNHEYLEPIDWFDKGHDLHSEKIDQHGFWRWETKHSTNVWDLPPAVADAAVEELRKARIKRQKSLHIVLIPKLFTHIWKKQLLKCCDFTIDIPAGQTFWSYDQFEPLTLGICFPFLLFRP